MVIDADFNLLGVFLFQTAEKMCRGNIHGDIMRRLEGLLLHSFLHKGVFTGNLVGAFNIRLLAERTHSATERKGAA